MRSKILFPVYGLEIETKDIYKFETRDDLVMFLEDFWDILTEDFEVFDADGYKIIFSIDYLTSKNESYKKIEKRSKDFIAELEKTL